jgi:outer membrane protein, multidrug efflux system
MRAADRSARLVLAAATSALLSACGPVGPNYVRPPLPTPQQYRFAESVAQGESLADAPWWQIFQDPTLQELIREAIAHNLDLRSAVARVEQARAQVGIVKSQFYPHVDGAATYGIQQNGSFDDEDFQHGGIYGFQLSWELDLFGRIRREKEAAYARLLASEQGRRGVLVTLVGDVASNYFQLRELDLELQISHQTLSSNDQLVAFFRNRLEGGVSNRLEVDRAVALRAQTGAAIPDIERQVAVVENALSLLVGRTPGPIARAPIGSESPLPPAIPPGLPASLLQRRPDVVGAEQLLVAANADVGAAKALFFPTVDLTGFLGLVSGDLATIIANGGGLGRLSGSLLQPVFEGGRLSNNLRAKRAMYDEALAQYQKAALNGYREVANALIAIQKSAAARDQRQVGVTALQDATELARDRYDSGLASYFEILEADQQLFERQILLAQTQGTEFQARADLYRALGGGWQQ